MWADYHLTAIPVDAPAFAITGQPHTPMRVAVDIERQARTTALDDRWALDFTEVAPPDAPGFRAGR